MATAATLYVIDVYHRVTGNLTWPQSQARRSLASHRTHRRATFAVSTNRAARRAKPCDGLVKRLREKCRVVTAARLTSWCCVSRTGVEAIAQSTAAGSARVSCVGNGALAVANFSSSPRGAKARFGEAAKTTARALPATAARACMQASEGSMHASGPDCLDPADHDSVYVVQTLQTLKRNDV